MTKCPFVKQTSTIDGEPAGECTFDKMYGGACPLLSDDSHEIDVMCFNLPARDYNVISRYYARRR